VADGKASQDEVAPRRKDLLVDVAEHVIDKRFISSA
jgi:hypothetical protein